MSISSEDNKQSYVASGSTTYVIPFYFTEKDHVQLFIDGVQKTINTDYTVSGEGEEDGGELTLAGALLSSPPDDGEIVVVIREVPVTQDDTLTESGPNSSKGNERRFDKLTMIAQQIAEKVSRALKFPLHSNVNPEIDESQIVPFAILAINEDADGIIAGPSYIDLQSGLATIAANTADAAASAVAAAASESAADTSADAAAASAAAAAASATAAAAAKVAAEAAQTAAAASATASAASATTANTKAGEAAASATTATTKAGEAAASAVTANTKAGEAAASATAADASADAAAVSETNAGASATAAVNAANSMVPTVTATQSIAGSGTVTVGTGYVQNRKVQGSGGPQSSANAPFGSAVATDGINVRLIGQHDTNTLTVPYSDTNYGCLLNGEAVLKKGYVLNLVFDLTALRWYEISRNF